MRVVSLCPSITETLVAIGGRRHLAAVTRFCTRPRSALWGLPRIGGTKNPDVGRILDLKPDVVFANEEENRVEDFRALEASGIEVDVSFPKRISDVPSDVRRWGRRIGSEAEADVLARQIELAEKDLASPPSRRFHYAYWIWKDPWITVSDDTYVADLVRLAGGQNVFGSERDRYPRATLEEARARGAEAHLLSSEPFPFREEKHDDLVRKLAGPQARRLYVAGDDYCWHGARTIEGLKRAADLRKIFG